MDNSVCYFYLWVALKVSTSEWPLLITLQFLAHMGLEKVALNAILWQILMVNIQMWVVLQFQLLFLRGNDWSINGSLPGPLTAAANPGILGGGGGGLKLRRPPPPHLGTPPATNPSHRCVARGNDVGGYISWVHTVLLNLKIRSKT